MFPEKTGSETWSFLEVLDDVETGLKYDGYIKRQLKEIEKLEKNENLKIDKNIKKALNKISNINKEILDKNLFPMTLGGEHSITPGCIVPFIKNIKIFASCILMPMQIYVKVIMEKNFHMPQQLEDV